MTSTTVSVVIPTLNAGQNIRGLIRILQEQTIPCEIIVIDSSSSDNTAGIAESSGVKKVITIQRRDFDHGGTRSTSVGYADGDIIVFLTQDAVPVDEKMIENLIRPFADEKVGVAYGRQLPCPDASPFAAHVRLFKYGSSSLIKSLKDKNKYGIETPFLSDSLAAYRKEALKEIGLFKRDIIFAEDVHAGAKLLLAGYKIAYAADAMVYHSHNHSMIEEFKRYFDTGVFYKAEGWITKEFGKTGGQGRRYIVSELSYLIKQRHYALIPQIIPRNILRFAGYVLGLNYKKLPRGICKKMSINKVWWDLNADAGE